jgi:L-ribulose-5-phosphate 3-epimerase
VHAKDGLAGTDATPLLGDGDGAVAATLDAVAAHGPAVRALVLENDHRSGDPARLDADLRRLHALAERLGRGRATAAAPTTETKGTAGR